jgi:tetratricopeptide (TPR) repeat protein
VAFAGAANAYAGAVEDGEAGLQALGRGDNDEAIRLFTHALKIGGLSRDDREFAYFNRGKAYLGKGDKVHGLADLKEALRLKPDDADAKGALEDASAAPEPSIVIEQPAPPTGPGGRWGMLADMAGHYYWYQVAGAPNTHVAVSHVQWVVPQQTLGITLKTKSGTAQAGEYQLDPATGKLLLAAVTGNTVSYGTADASVALVTTYSYFKTTAIHDTLTRAADGSIHEHEQKFIDGTWRDSGDVTFIEVSQETLEAEGFLKKHK